MKSKGGNVTISKDIKVSPVQYSSFGYGVSVTVPIEDSETVEQALTRCKKTVDDYYAKTIGRESEKMVETISLAIAAGKKSGR